MERKDSPIYCSTSALYWSIFELLTDKIIFQSVDDETCLKWKNYSAISYLPDEANIHMLRTLLRRNMCLQPHNP